MKACILIIFFFRNLSFSSFRIFRSVVLREKRKNCWSFRKRKQLKFISRPRIPAIFVTGGRQLLKASWRYCCSLLFWRISGKVAQALERALATRHAGEKGSMALPRSPSPYPPFCSFICTLTLLTSLSAIPKLLLLSKSNMAATPRKHWLSAYFFENWYVCILGYRC